MIFMKKFFLFLLLSFTSVRSFSQEHSLDFYLGQAKDNSPLLKDYQNQIQSGRLDSQLVRASFKVQVNGISNDLYAPVIKGYGYDNVITNGGQLSAQVQATKTLVSKSNLAAQLETVGLDNKSIGNSAVIAERDLKKSITAQYIVAYGDMVAMKFERETLDLLKREDAILKALTQTNVYRQTDYLTFYVTLQQQQLLFRQSEVQFKNDYASLNYLCGIQDTAVVDLPDPALKISALPDAYSSMFYRQYTIDSLKNINQRSVIAYGYKPKLSVFADAGYLSSMTYQMEKNFGTSAGLSLNVPIYDGRQRKLKYSKIDIAERTRAAYRDFFVRQYNQQIAQLTQQLHSTEALVEEIKGQISYSSSLVDVNMKLLETGNVHITDLVLALNTYLNARNLLNQNYLTLLQIINQIDYWENF